ncbi:MAG: class I tRNA ligase family protein, partial [Oscillospiraceae bacterium]
CGKEVINPQTIAKVAGIFREKGADAWYELDARDLLPENYVCPHCASKNFKKETDIMDVWFDSGVSHAAVCDTRDYLHSPADLYLEGADQYRGWFQSSLLTSVATKGIAPYKTVVTHGWVVDGEGKKMSKSIGNVINPDDIVNEYGADILRLWVASSDYHADIRVSKDILKQLSEVYRKIRNTARFILGCISDFDPKKDMVDDSELKEIDRFAMMRLNQLVGECTKAYDDFEYHLIFHAVHNFCVVDMSNFYLDALKDRLYVEGTNSATRRAAQTTIYKVLDVLTRLIAPILAFTSEEIWSFMPHENGKDTRNVLFNEMPKFCDNVDAEFLERWNKIHEIRDEVKKALEESRNQKVIGSSLDAKVILKASGEIYKFLKSCENILPEILIVSELSIEEGADELAVQVERAGGQKCERCWSFSGTVGQIEGHPTICERCAKVLSE